MLGITRRHFLKRVAASTAAVNSAWVLGRLAAARGESPRPAAPEHTLTVISGSPRERGRSYGRAFAEGIRSFLDREIYRSFTKAAPTREEVLRYAGACGREIKGYSSLVHDELEGIAEGSGIRLEEAVLITLHEELWHKGVLPAVEKCTAIAAGPPDTADGSTYVGQTWDWMESVYGLSGMLLWKRSEGPSLLSYAYPGLWVGAGMNSAGLALTWTSGDGLDIKGPRVGIPSYVLIAQILYQSTLKDALAEARRARHAGWFTFVLGDGEGRLANVEGSPEELVVEETRGHVARALFGTRRMTRSPAEGPIKLNPRVRRVYETLGREKGKVDAAAMKRLFADHGPEGQNPVCCHPATLDAMLFDTTKREAHLTRGPACSARWKRFTFEAGQPAS